MKPAWHYDNNDLLAIKISEKNDTSSHLTLLKGIKESSAALHVCLLIEKQAGVPVIQLTHGEKKEIERATFFFCCQKLCRAQSQLLNKSESYRCSENIKIALL